MSRFLGKAKQLGRIRHTLTLAIAVLVATTPFAPTAHARVLVRIDADQGDAPLARGAGLVGGPPVKWLDAMVPDVALSDLPPGEFEIVGGKSGQWLDLLVTEEVFGDLCAAKVKHSVLCRDTESESPNIACTYWTLARTEQILHDIADKYPEITKLYTIGASCEGRPIWCLEITDNPGVDEGEPGVFYMGLHHASEWPTLAICLYLADRLTSEYASDAGIAQVVDNRRLWLVPCVNPDGYYYCHDQGNWWRGNRHHFVEQDEWGVDPNRNYRGSENGAPSGAWGSIGPSMFTYHGEFPESEPEIQAVCKIFRDNDICAAITWHTFAECVMWPWAYSREETTPDDEAMSKLGEEIASRITGQDGHTEYRPIQTSKLTLVAGETTDWAYGYAHYVQGRTTFAYTIEACKEFAPTAYKLPQICAENFDGAFYLLREASRIRDTVVPRVMPPTIAPVPHDGDGDFTLSWSQVNPEAAPDCFELDELTDLSIVTDDADSPRELWKLDGFAVSDREQQPGGGCYQAQREGRGVSSMTSAYPIPVVERMKLSLWCLHEMGGPWDCGFVEVSSDGRTYDILDQYTGSSDGWVFCEYDLGDFAGKSVFVRFRCATHGRGGGAFCLDDITPVADFGSVTTLSDSVKKSDFPVTKRAEGDYYYRVRGRNAERGWGDFSTLVRVHVGPPG